MGWFTTDNTNKEIMCKYCNQKGFVKTTKAMRKGGIDPGKIAGHAVLTFVTAGIWLPFILASGVCRDIEVTEMHCEKCGTKWDVV